MTDLFFCVLLTVPKCTLLVPSQNPDFDVCFGEQLNRLWYFVLQLVFDGSRSQELQVTHLSTER